MISSVAMWKNKKCLALPEIAQPERVRINLMEE